MKSTVIAIDLAKDVFEVLISRKPGQVTSRHRVARKKLAALLEQQPESTVLLEACATSHHWGRRFLRMGHDVRLLPPHLVRPYVQGNKTDRTDAKGMLEAYRNEEIHPVPVKSVEQQAALSLHRFRSRWQGERTARINAVRGTLREFGFVIPVGARHVVPTVRAWVEDSESDLPDLLRPVLYRACEEIDQLTEEVANIDRQLQTFTRQDVRAQWLMSVPGIGVITATALVAFVGDASRFKSCRSFANFFGLTPREHSTGSRRWLGSISKRGDTYLRTLLIHGARSVLRSAKRSKEPNRLHRWGLHLASSSGHNTAAVAIANKMARFAWAVWIQERMFVPFEKAA
jgi:transposase